MDRILHKQTLGKKAEQLACQFLQNKGLYLLAENYHCYFGEIDLIMQDQDDIVFVEVRSRTRFDYGNALESISKSKINKLIKTATHYLQHKKLLDKVNGRFDVVTVQPTDGKLACEWIKNAFWV